MSVDPEVQKLVEARAREIAREEVASAFGLMLRRLQGRGDGRPGARNRPLRVSEFSSIVGEGLRDFGGPDAPGPPGEATQGAEEGRLPGGGREL